MRPCRAVPVNARPQGRAPGAHLARFRSGLHADGCTGINRLYGERVAEVACRAHVGRKFFDVRATTGSATTCEALDHIVGLYSLSRTCGVDRPTSDHASDKQEPDRCWPHSVNGSMRPVPSWRGVLTSRSIRNALTRWSALSRYVEYGRLETDNNAAERSLRGIAVGRKN